jgi:DNA processing protein
MKAACYWLVPNLTAGLGPTKGRKLVEHFARIANIFKATLTELEATDIQTGFCTFPGNWAIDRTGLSGVGACGDRRDQLVSFDDPAYPQQLKQIYDPPLVLYLGAGILK